MPGSATARLSPVCRRRPKTGQAIVTALAMAVCAIPLYAGMLGTQKHENRHEIDQLEDEWRNAILTSNTTVMDSLLADDYIAITASGTLQTKAETLANLRSGQIHFTSLTVADRKVRFYGRTALVTSLAKVQATTPDGPINGSYRYTRVYVRNAQGQWKIVSFEASRIREPGPHHRGEFH
jgi:ketosteroid isomerase-like protein